MPSAEDTTRQRLLNVLREDAAKLHEVRADLDRIGKGKDNYISSTEARGLHALALSLIARNEETIGAYYKITKPN